MVTQVCLRIKLVSTRNGWRCSLNFTSVWPRHKDVLISTKWSRGHDILSRSQELICCGHDKTSLSEPNMSPPGRSKCFVRLFGDHLLFPVDDLWPTFCTIWISALWILSIEHVPNFFFILKTWSCIFKNWIFAVKEFRTKNQLFENTCICKKLP